MPSHDWPTVRRSIIALAVAAMVVVVVAVSVVLCLDLRIPKRAITPSAMGETSVRIGMYYQRNKRMPPDLSELPARDGYANRTTDAWGRPLIYTTGPDDTFTLSSLGGDGAPGGTGDNADVACNYRIERNEVQEVSVHP